MVLAGSCAARKMQSREKWFEGRTTGKKRHIRYTVLTNTFLDFVLLRARPATAESNAPYLYRGIHQRRTGMGKPQVSGRFEAAKATLRVDFRREAPGDLSYKYLTSRGGEYSNRGRLGISEERRGIRRKARRQNARFDFVSRRKLQKRNFRRKRVGRLRLEVTARNDGYDSHVFRTKEKTETVRTR